MREEKKKKEKEEGKERKGGVVGGGRELGKLGRWGGSKSGEWKRDGKSEGSKSRSGRLSF